MLLRLLPGLYVAALWLAGVIVIRRWFEPLPWRVALACLFLVLALLHPVLLGGDVLLPLDKLRGFPIYADLPAPQLHGNFLQQDLLTLVLPSLQAVRDSLARGEWPLWNHRLGAGIPLLADPQSQALQPLALLALCLPLFQVPGVLAALRLLGALLGTWLFLRRLKIGEGAAFFGAAAWGFGGFVMLWLGWPLANAGVLMPVALWSTARCFDHGERSDFVLATLASGSLLLAGQPEAILYSTVMNFGYALVRTFDNSAPHSWNRAMKWLAAVAIGAALSMPALLPALSAAGESERAAMLAFRRDQGGAEAPGSWGDLLRHRWLPIVAPNAFGNDRFLAYWGGENINEDAAGFVGTATLLLALAGCFARRGDLVREEYLFQSVFVLSLLAIVIPPGWRHFLDRLPLGLQSPSYHHRLLLLAGFAMVCLAARELDRAVRGRGRWGPTLLVALALAGLIAWGYSANANPADAASLAALRDGWLHWQLRALAVGTVVLVLLRGRGVVLPAVAGAAIFELLLAHSPANPAAPASLAFPRREAIARLAAEAPPPSRVVVADGALPPNVISLFGLSQARAHNPMQSAKCGMALGALAAVPGELLETPEADRLMSAAGVSAVLGTRRTPILPQWNASFVGPSAIVLSRRPTGIIQTDGSRRSETSRMPRPAEAIVTPTRVSIRLNGPSAEGEEEPSRLTIGVCRDGGWRPVVDGAATSPEMGVSPFVVLQVASRSERVDLLLRPPGFLGGLVAAAIALGAGLAWWVPPPRRLQFYACREDPPYQTCRASVDDLGQRRPP